MKTILGFHIQTVRKNHFDFISNAIKNLISKELDNAYNRGISPHNCAHIFPERPDEWNAIFMQLFCFRDILLRRRLPHNS